MRTRPMRSIESGSVERTRRSEQIGKSRLHTFGSGSLGADCRAVGVKVSRRPRPPTVGDPGPRQFYRIASAQRLQYPPLAHDLGTSS